MAMYMGRWKKLKGRPAPSNRFVGNKLPSIKATSN